MSLKDEVELLRRVPLFAKVSPAKLKLLAFTSDRVTFGADQVMFNQGDQGEDAYVVLSGTADILVNLQSGQVKIAGVEPNEIVGEIAILCDVVRTATVRTVTPVEALRIRKDQFLTLLAEFPEVAIEIMRVLADRLNRTTTALIEARDESAKIRK
jgi:CRP-like cAMP-binding protein